MKKIFNILMIAAVALGAVACQNDIDDNLSPEQNGESVSIRVTLDEATKVALGEAVDGKLPLNFEEGDELYVVTGWADSTEDGYYFTYTKQDGDNYVFTCTAQGVSSIVGAWKGVYYLGGRKQAIGAYGDTASESINGVFMKGAGSIGGSSPIELTVAPVLKLKSDYAVTISVSNYILCNGTTTYTTQKTGEWIYLATNTAGTFTISASVLGQKVKEATIELKDNTIHNLGVINAPEIEKDEANITVDGNFEDWDDVKVNVASQDGTQLHTLKSYVDANNIYVYIEFDKTNIKYLDMFFDFDVVDTTTGNAYAWQWSNKANLRTEGKLYNWSSDVQTVYNYAGASQKIYNDTTATWDSSSLTINCAEATEISANVYATELSIARDDTLNTMIGDRIGVGVFLMCADWSSPGYLPTNDTMLIVPVE